MKPHKATTIVLIINLLTLFAGDLIAAPMSTAFTYQGRLSDTNGPVTGNYDMRFAVYDAVTNGSAVGPALTNTVAVSNGLFTAVLDFGSGVFAGDARWLELGVRTSGGGDFTNLVPRQELTSRPYALYAPGAGTAGAASNLLGTLPSGQLSGIYANALQFTNAGNSFAGSFTGNGSGLTNLNANNLASGTVPNARLAGTYSSALTFNNAADSFTGNSFTGNGNGLTNLDAGNLATGTVPDARLGANVARTNSSPIFNGTVTAVGDLKGTRLNVGTNELLTSSYSSIAGGRYNTNQATYSFIGGGLENFIGTNTQDATIGGGSGNSIMGSYTSEGTIAGGDGNLIQSVGTTDSASATIGGGNSNSITNSPEATIVGGAVNVICDNSRAATIAGGRQNFIDKDSGNSFIGGGYGNIIKTNADYSFIAAGYSNVVTKQYAFVAGHRAKANHQGAFVWADSQDAEFASTANDQLLIRASGGVGIGKNNPATALDVAGTVTATGFAGSGSGLTNVNADMVDGVHATSIPQIRASGVIAKTNSVTLTIPHYTIFTLQLSSGWPASDGLAFVQGCENDNYVGVTYIKYNGTDGTSAVGGQNADCTTTNLVLQFGSSASPAIVRCNADSGLPPYHLVLQASSRVELLYRLIY